MTHTLTEAQQQAIKPLHDQSKELARAFKEAQERLSWFLSYCVTEAKLPTDSKYSLSEDGTQLISNPGEEKQGG